MAELSGKTRCLLCSLMCPVALERNDSNGDGVFATEYAIENPLTQGRLCFRGHYVAEMASHPFRVTSAEIRDGAECGDVRVSLEQAITRLANRLASAGARSAVIVDGNSPNEDICAALRLARDVIRTDMCCVYLPESDAAMLRGIAPGTPILPMEDVAACDAFLIVGDVFATHPVISRPILEARADRKARIFGVDCARNRVAGFADEFLCVKPGTEVVLIAALCKLAGLALPPGSMWAHGQSAEDLAAMARIPASTLHRIADAFRSAKYPAVLLAPVPGRMSNVAEAARMASCLCELPGSHLMPMFRYGNAVGAAQVAGGMGAQPFEDVIHRILSAEVEVLLSLGCDVLSVLTMKQGQRLREAVSMLAVASPMRNRSTETADILLPLGMWFEQHGSVLGATGELEVLTPAASAPGGDMATSSLCRRLARAMNRPWSDDSAVPRASAFMGQTSGEIEIGEASSDGLRLVSRADTSDFDTGSISRVLAWARYLEPAPELLMNPADAKDRSLGSRARVCVRASGHETEARLRTSADMPRGVTAISAAFEDTRELFTRRGESPDTLEMAWTKADVTSGREA